MRNTIICGDVLTVLKTLPGQLADCVVTSPPYWGLRNYGTEPQVWGGDPECKHEWGSEIPGDPRGGSGPKAKEFYAGDGKTTYARQVPRGAFCQHCGAWLGSLGLEPTVDLYVKHIADIFREVRRVLKDEGTLWLNMGDGYARQGGLGRNRYFDGREEKPEVVNAVMNTLSPGLKEKDLLGQPWRVAFALQADGWYLRSDIIWAKPNPMPESVTDRPTKSHEYIFLMSKKAKYYYDAEAIKEECSESTHARISQDLAAQVRSFRANGGNKTNGPMRAVIAGSTRKLSEEGSGIKANKSFEAAMVLKVTKRNKRTVWEIPVQGFSEAHFATFPEKLIEPCIRAGCPNGGLVLDPFMGSGTTALVAKKLCRDYLGIELNPEYVDMANRRVKNEMGLFV